MQDLLHLIGLALLPAIGNLAGGLLSELAHISTRTLSLTLHAAMGVIFGIVVVELLPRAFGGTSPGLSTIAFALGAAFYLLLDKLSRVVRPAPLHEPHIHTAGTRFTTWVVYAAVVVNLFNDGLLVGVSASLSFTLALVLTLGQMIVNIPEGYAVIAAFRQQNVSRARRLLMSASFRVPAIIGALMAYLAMRRRSETTQLAALAFAAGLLLAGAAREILSEARRKRAPRTVMAAALCVGGFVLFAVAAFYIDA